MVQTNGGEILTTFQAARLCGVSHKSIERWIDAGILRGFRTPGGHRRVYRVDLIDFVQQRRTTERVQSGRSAANNRPKILVVDDDAMILSVMQEYFETACKDRFHVETAASGYEAGLKVARFGPHVVLLDLMMPDLDGFEVCRMLKNDRGNSTTAVIAVTGSDQAAQQAQESGMFQRVLLKPIRMAAVREVIEELLLDRGFVSEALVGT